jgi:hypothetical protein
MSADGRKMYVSGITAGVSAAVFQFSLSTPWDASTATSDSVSVSTYTYEAEPRGIAFSPDGLNLYVIGENSDKITRYTLGTAWDLNTASYHSQSPSIASYEGIAQALRFSAGGTQVLILGSGQDKVIRFALDEPWDVASLTYVDEFNAANQNAVSGSLTNETAPTALHVTPDLTKLWLTGNAAKYAYTYALRTQRALSITEDVTVKSLTTRGKSGYADGAGGSVTQATSKSTGVTLNAPTGKITMHAASLAAATAVGFTLTNSAIGADDVVLPSIRSGATADAYSLNVDAIAAGSCRFSLRNHTAGALAEAVVLNFVVIKGAST